MIATIREAAAGDDDAIDALLAGAFGGRAEADLAASLREAGDLVVELVAFDGKTLAGHAAFPRLSSDAGVSIAALAPLSVRAEQRRRGLGDALVRRGLETLAQRGFHWCLVLGDPDYYARFGFSADAAAGFRTPYDGPHQQALALCPDAPRAGGRVVYPRDFGALG